MDFLKKQQPKVQESAQELSFNGSNDMDNVPVPPANVQQNTNSQNDPELDRIQKSIDESMQASVPNPEPERDIEDSFDFSSEPSHPSELVPSVDDVPEMPEQEETMEQTTSDLPDLPDLPQELAQDEESSEEDFSLPNAPQEEDMPSQEEIEDVFGDQKEESHEEFKPTAQQDTSAPYLSEEMPVEDEGFVEAREFYEILQGIKALKRSIKDAGKTLNGFESNTEAFEKKAQTLLSDVDTMQEQLIQIDEGLFEG